MAPPAPLAISHLLAKNLTYTPARSWVPITMLAKISNVLVVRKSLPANSLAELIAYGKANPGKLTYATQGPGSTAHLSAAQLEVLTGIKMVAVPYRGAQLALNDILSGNVDMFFDTLATSVPLYRGDKVRLLAVAGLERAKAVPELPTFPEAGVPGFRSITWFALAAPPGTPVCARRTAQPRHRRNPAQPGGRRAARRALARSRCDEPCGYGCVLQRRNRIVEQRDPAGRRHAAIMLTRLRIGRYFVASWLKAKSSGGFGPQT